MTPEGAPGGLGLRKAAVGGLAWTAGGRWAQQLLALAGTAALAHLLTPADFGLVAMTVVFTGFAAVFVDLGLTAALVERRQLTARHLNAAFWTNAAMGLAVTGVLAGMAPLVAALYDEPRLVRLMPALALTFVFIALSGVQVALAQRAMNFRRLVLVDIGATILSLVVGVSAALAGAGVWSLVLQVLVHAAAQSAGLWALADWRPTRSFDRIAARELLGFGGNLAAATGINYWMRTADNFLIGAFRGPAQLGIYTRAYQLMLMPLSLVTGVTGRVMFPALVQIRDDTNRVRRIYVRSIGLIAFVTFPAMTIAFVVAEPLILLLFGRQWADSIPLFRILCLAGIVQSVASSAGWLYQAYGRTDWLLRWALVSGAITLVAFAIGIRWGATGVAVAYLVRTVIVGPIALAIPGRLIGLRARDVIHAVGRVTCACLAMLPALLALERLLGEAPLGVRLACEVGVAGFIYVALARIFRFEALAEARSLVRTLGGRRERLAAPV